MISDIVTWLNETGITEANTGHGGMGGPGGAGGNRGDMFSNLDEETRQKVQSIMEQERNGVITQEEAQAQMEELGVELPQRGEPQEQNKQ